MRAKPCWAGTQSGCSDFRVHRRAAMNKPLKISAADGDKNGSAICDIGAYEYYPNSRYCR